MVNEAGVHLCAGLTQTLNANKGRQKVFWTCNAYNQQINISQAKPQAGINQG